MPEGRLVRQDDETFEGIKMKGTSKPLGREVVEGLIADDGLLAGGALPAVKAASEAGSKTLLQLLDDDAKPIQKMPKKKAVEDKDKVKEIKATTPLEMATAKMAACLDQVTKARAKSLQLTGVDYGKELSAQLLSHANSMEDLWKRLQKTAESDDKGGKGKKQADIMSLIQEVDKKSKWWTKAEAPDFQHCHFTL